MTPEEVHNRGLEEVERIYNEMQKVGHNFKRGTNRGLEEVDRIYNDMKKVEHDFRRGTQQGPGGSLMHLQRNEKGRT